MGSVVDHASTLMPTASRRAARPDDVAVLTIAYHPDVSRVGERTVIAGELEISRSAPTFEPPGGGNARPLADRGLSRNPVVRIKPAGDGVALEAVGSTAASIDGRPLAGAAARAWQTFDRGALERGV